MGLVITSRRTTHTEGDMELEEMFDSSVRSAGDFAGVFEYDGETGYFYLYDMSREESQRVLAAIRVVGTKPDFDQDSIEIKWDKAERRVGLFIRGALWAALTQRPVPASAETMRPARSRRSLKR